MYMLRATSDGNLRTGTLGSRNMMKSTRLTWHCDKTYGGDGQHDMDFELVFAFSPGDIHGLYWELDLPQRRCIAIAMTGDCVRPGRTFR